MFGLTIVKVKRKYCHWQVLKVCVKIDCNLQDYPDKTEKDFKDEIKWGDSINSSQKVYVTF